MSNLVKPHLISIVTISALIILLLLWPCEPETSLLPDNNAASSLSSDESTWQGQDKRQKSVPVLPPVQLLQPDPGLSQDELYIMAANARRCFNVPKTKTELDAWLAQANANDALPGYIEHILHAFEPCQKVNVNYDYITTFELLARQGHEQALWQFWRLTDNEVFRLKDIEELDRDAAIAARREFQLTKYQLAEQHLLLGNERAMMRLMNAYRYLDPATGGQNTLRSLALANLVLSITDDQDNYRRADWHKQFMEKRMSAEEAQIAVQIAQQMAAQIKPLTVQKQAPGG